jgi:hypothetical protein
MMHGRKSIYPEVITIREEFNEMLSHTYFGIHVKFPIFLSEFKETWIFPTFFNRSVQYKISRIFFPWASSCSIRREGQTDDTNISFPELRNRAQNLDRTIFDMSWTLLSMLGSVFPFWQVPYHKQSPEMGTSSSIVSYSYCFDWTWSQTHRFWNLKFKWSKNIARTSETSLEVANTLYTSVLMLFSWKL